MPAPASPPAGSLVLMVDDDPVAVRLVRGILDRRGFEVEGCHDLGEARDRLRRPPAPDLLLLDLELPGGDGIDLCRAVRGQAELAQVPVMICSARAKEKFIDVGFQAGANDYIEKPFTEAELVARVENLARAARSGQALRSTLRQLITRNETMALELEAARKVQGALLPQSLAPHPSLRSAVLYEPMFGVGGDLYDIDLAADGTIRLLIADVSGHGVFAALLAAFFRMGYQVFAEREAGPAEVLAALHREFCRSVQSGHFVTALLVWLDPSGGRMRYSSAGHVAGLLRRAACGRLEQLRPTGPVLGLVEQSRFGEVETVLEPRDLLLLLTDGVTEAPGRGGEPYGISRVETVVRRHPSGGPAELLQDLRIDLEQYQHEPDADDDCTALAVEWIPVKAPQEEERVGAGEEIVADCTNDSGTRRNMGEVDAPCGAGEPATSALTPRASRTRDARSGRADRSRAGRDRRNRR